MNDIIFTSAQSQSVFLAQNLEWNLSFEHAANRFAVLQGDGDYYQDLGNNSLAGDLYFIFTPNSADEEAFFNAIRESGVATVTQPDRNEPLNIQPLNVEKKLGLVEDVNRVLYTISFVVSRRPEDVTSTQALYNSLENQNNATVLSAGTALDGSQDVSTLTAAARQVANFTNALNSASRNLGVAVTELESSIDDIVGNPVKALIAFKQLIQQPGIIYDRLTSKLNGYAELIIDLLDIQPYAGQNETQKANDLFFAESMTSTVLATMTQSSTEGSYDTKEQVLAAAEILVDTYAINRDTLDTYQENGFYQQTGQVQQSTSRLVNNTAAFLFAISFNLKTEFTYTVDSPVTIYDIMAEFYADKLQEQGEIAIMDYIVKTNNFREDELIEVPTGRKVLVYV